MSAQRQDTQLIRDNQVGVFDALADGGYEQVLFCNDAASGLRSIIVIHDTTLGPAVGGVRMQPYPNEAAALADCLRLAKAMTFKTAAAGAAWGGGKSVIIGDPARDKTDALLRAHGRFIQTLAGRYLPGIDVGTEQRDLEIIGLEAEEVTCVGQDPSPMTALGVREGIRACLVHADGLGDLRGVRVAIQGAGHVGSALARLLRDEGAFVMIADVDARRAERVAREVGAEALPAADITRVPCDVLAPCALGGVINDQTLPGLRCRIVAGAANNVLAEPRHGDALAEAGILYAPDYFINAGGIIHEEEQWLGHDLDRGRRRVLGVGAMVADVLARARDDSMAPHRSADLIVSERIAQARREGASMYLFRQLQDRRSVPIG